VGDRFDAGPGRDRLIDQLSCKLHTYY
jgi:hypothetical protein